ncbi:hypothetical protein WL22_22905 [Burkholderia ubonensis]|nr:hypothetical protein WL22_22905 [Burkholderia ubonensis]
MSNEKYRNVICDMCRYIGLSAWEQVADAQCLAISGKLVGVFFDDEVDADRLFIYFDLGGSSDGVDIPYRTLLEANLTAAVDVTGHFGINPASGDIIYMVVFLIEPADTAGVRLAELLARSVGTLDAILARHRLHA